MKKFLKLNHIVWAAILLITSVVIGNATTVLAADRTPETALSTQLRINENPIQDGAKYGEGKFQFYPTYKFADDAKIENGDTLAYKILSQFKIDFDKTADVIGAGGVTVVGTISTKVGSQDAVFTVTNAAYFEALPEDKQVTPQFTAVQADSVPLDVEQTIDVPGAQTYRLTRILVGEDPIGFAKWGTQNDPTDPNIINWGIRVNKYIQPWGETTISDAIPSNQELIVGSFKARYFTSWVGADAIYKRDPITNEAIEVPQPYNLTEGGFLFSLGNLDNQGVFITYQTCIIGEIDKVNKKSL